MNEVKQIGGSHYTDDAARCPHCGGVIQHWDLFGMAPGLVYASTKYLARLGRKAGEDTLTAIDKAISYLQKYRIIVVQQLERGKAGEVAELSAQAIRTSGYIQCAVTDVEQARARADAYANEVPNADVPVGWVLEEVHGRPGWWHFRQGSGDWGFAYQSRQTALDQLRKLYV